LPKAEAVVKSAAFSMSDYAGYTCLFGDLPGGNQKAWLLRLGPAGF